jgi:citrate synthase
LNAAVAAGILTIGDSHGGAIEACAKLLQEHAGEGDPERTAARVVAEAREAKRRLPGFGHRMHGTDPRSVKLLEIAREDGLAGDHVALALAIEAELERQTGRRLPLNVDGAIAAVASEMGFDWRLGKGFFIVSRAAGLVAHAFEERAREKPMRKLADFTAVYDGPEPVDGDSSGPGSTSS